MANATRVHASYAQKQQSTQHCERTSVLAAFWLVSNTAHAQCFLVSTSHDVSQCLACQHYKLNACNLGGL